MRVWDSEQLPLRDVASHVVEREHAILRWVWERGFVRFRELAQLVGTSPGTLRRDLERLAAGGRIVRFHGGVRFIKGASEPIPVLRNAGRSPVHKDREIVRVAATLCSAGEAVMIGGGSTMLEMGSYLAGLNLLILTNSLRLMNVLLAQPGTRVLVTGGTVFREQGLIISIRDEDLMPRLHAPKVFIGATAVGPAGITQRDPVLAAADRCLIDRADQVILIADSSKFHDPAGSVVCDLEEVDLIVTDRELALPHREMLAARGLRVMTPPVGAFYEAGVNADSKLHISRVSNATHNSASMTRRGFGSPKSSRKPA